MAFETVGVRAVVEGAQRYIQDSKAVASATAAIGKSTADAAQEAQRSTESLRSFGSELEGVGQRAVLLGAALAVPGAAAATLAIQFESAFTGVRKTVDATEPQFAALRTGIIDLTRELPVTASEIAAVAQAAGQLGVEVPNLLVFTKTMVQLGEATNLSSEEAAIGLARFANIIQFPLARIEELGSTLVALGNTTATTEAEILELGLRLAGAGQVVGLSADEIFGFAAALSAVGIRAEAGGTAISRVFVDVANAVRSGGDELETFASISGMSVDEFTKAFEEDAAGALIAFIEGLGRVEAAGGNVFEVLGDVELADIRVRDALLRAAGAGDSFRETLDTASTAIGENTALSTEYARRLETVDSQMRLLRNSVQATLIEAGSAALPIIKALTQAFTGLADLIGAIPAPVTAAALALGVFAGGALILVGTLGLMAGAIVNIAASLTVVSSALKTVTVAQTLFNAAVAASPIGITALLVGISAAAVGWQIYKIKADEATEATDRAAEGAKAAYDTAFRVGEERTRALLTELDGLIEKQKEFARTGKGSADELDRLNAVAGGYRSALAAMGAETAEAAADTQVLANELKDLTADAYAAEVALRLFKAGVTGPLRSAAIDEAASQLRALAGQEAGVASLIEEIRRRAGLVTVDTSFADNRRRAAEEAATDEIEAAKRAAEARYQIAVDLQRRIEQAEKAARDRQISALDLFGSVVVEAIRAREDAALDSTVTRIEQERKAYDTLYKGRIAGIESARDAQIGALNDEIRALDAASAADERAELERQLAIEFDPRRQAEIRQRIVEFDRRQTRQALEDRIENVRKGADEAIRIQEQERDALLENLKVQEDAAREAYSAATDAYAIEAAARVLIEKGAQDEIVALINSYGDQWRVAGLSLGTQLADGIRAGSAGAFVGGGLAAVPGTAQSAGASAEQAAFIEALQAQGERAKAAGAPGFVLAALRENLADEGALPRFATGGVVPGAPGREVPIMAHGQEVVLPYTGGGMSGNSGGPLSVGDIYIDATFQLANGQFIDVVDQRVSMRIDGSVGHDGFAWGVRRTR